MKKKKLSPTCKEYWTPERRKAQKETVEAFHDQLLESDDWGKEWRDKRYGKALKAKMSAVMQKCWDNKTKAERAYIHAKRNAAMLKLKMDNIASQGGKIPYSWVRKLRELEGVKP